MKKFFYILILCSVTGIALAQVPDSELAQDAEVQAEAAAVQQEPQTAAEEVSGADTPLTPPDAAEASAEPAVAEPVSVESTPPVTMAEEVPAQAVEPSASASSSIVVIEDEAEDTPDKVYSFQTAEMNEPTRRTKQRPLSMHSGLKLSVLGANNIFSITDFFGEKMVLDLNKLAKKTIRSGMHIGALIDFDWFFQFTVLEEHTIKLSTTLDGRIWANASKSMLDLIAKGNADGKPVKGSLNASANVFADTGIMYRLNKPFYSFSARLAYFVPVAYMRNPQAAYSMVTDSSGRTVMSFKGEANVYGHLAGLAAGSQLNIAQLFKDGGLDISLSGSYQPAGWVNITGGIDYLPLMVVSMNKGIRNSFSFEGELTNILEALSKKKNPFQQKDSTQEFLSADLPTTKIMRPCKLRIGADFKPFMNNYLILSPSFAIPVVNAKPFYMDGGLKIESRFAKDVLGVSWEIGCIERIWRHELALFVDSRFATFTLAASLASHDFARTFTTLSGAGLRFGIGIGF